MKKTSITLGRSSDYPSSLAYERLNQEEIDKTVYRVVLDNNVDNMSGKAVLFRGHADEDGYDVDEG